MKHIKNLAQYLLKQKSYSSLDLCTVYYINRVGVGLVLTKARNREVGCHNMSKKSRFM